VLELPGGLIPADIATGGLTVRVALAPSGAPVTVIDAPVVDPFPVTSPLATIDTE